MASDGAEGLRKIGGQACRLIREHRPHFRNERMSEPLKECQARLDRLCARSPVTKAGSP